MSWRVELDSENPTIISVWRDAPPLPAEPKIARIRVVSNDSYYSRRPTPVVADYAHLEVGRLSKFVVKKSSPEADRLVAALKEGPIEPYVGVGEITIDVDRIKRPRVV